MTAEQNEEQPMDQLIGKEQSLPAFKEIPVAPGVPPRCVDGRPAPESQQGYQSLGGNMQEIVVHAIATSTPLTAEFINTDMQALQQQGEKLGLHRGSHMKPEANVCDCGFCDKLQGIVAKAKTEKTEIMRRLQELFAQNAADLPSFNLIEQAYALLDQYDVANIQITGEDIIAVGEKNGATVETVQADHAEAQAFLNLKPGVTLDTKGMNADGNQAFNLDVPSVVDRATKLGVAAETTIGLSAILYMATEMVLVEDKGKPALPVVLNK